MNQNEFKVLDWLREIRDQHSEKIKHMTADEILKEAQARYAKFHQQNNDGSNQHLSND